MAGIRVICSSEDTCPPAIASIWIQGIASPLQLDTLSSPSSILQLRPRRLPDQPGWTPATDRGMLCALLGSSPRDTGRRRRYLVRDDYPNWRRAVAAERAGGPMCAEGPGEPVVAAAAGRSGARARGRADSSGGTDPGTATQGLLRAPVAEQRVAPARKPTARAEAERLRGELTEALETVRELSAALSLAVDENTRLRRLVPLSPAMPPPRTRTPAVRLRSR